MVTKLPSTKFGVWGYFKWGWKVSTIPLGICELSIQNVKALCSVGNQHPFKVVRQCYLADKEACDKWKRELLTLNCVDIMCCIEQIGCKILVPEQVLCSLNSSHPAFEV